MLSLICLQSFSLSWNFRLSLTFPIVGVTFWKGVVGYPSRSYVLICSKHFLPVASGGSTITAFCTKPGMRGSCECERWGWPGLCLLIRQEVVLFSALLSPCLPASPANQTP